MRVLPAAAPVRLLALLAGLAVLGALLLLAVATPATAGPEVRRLGGDDRYTTAVAISRASHPRGAAVAVVTTGASFPDALAGGPAAAALGGPVLLVGRDRVPPVVLDELRRLQPTRVLLLGGTSALSDEVQAELVRAGLDVERLAGDSRYETAARVSQRAFPSLEPLVYVATGADYPDALAGAAAAGRAGAPVLLVAPDRLPAATADELTRLQPQEVVVLGGPGAVSTRVEQQLAAYAPTVRRIAGEDRYATAAAIARATPGRPDAVLLATGRGFADALAGGPAAAAANAPVLLVPGTCIPGPVHVEMKRHDYPPVTLLGGATVLTPEVARLRPCFQVPDGELTPGVTLTSIRDPRGPWSIKLVEVAPSGIWRLDPMLAQDALPGLETVGSMARRTDAVVAVNGDFTDVAAGAGGRPLHAYAQNGRLLQAAPSLELLGANFAVESREGVPRLGAPTVDVGFHSPGSRVAVTRINRGASDSGSIALTTPEAGPVAPVPGDSCALRLRTRGGPELLGSGRVTQGYEILDSGCSSAPMTGAGDVVTTPLGGRWDPLFRSLTPGQVVSVSWTPGWPDVLDILGGHPRLLEEGAVRTDDVSGTDAFSQRNPRTAIGYRPDGTVLLVTVDGRGADGSVGMSLRELASLFVRLGASDALNLDGGGSTTMVIGGEVQNSPSDGPERPVSSALLIRSGSAPAGGMSTQSRSEPAPPPAPLPAQEQARAEQAHRSDPGSAAGLLEHTGRP
jgi:putative cell wall-binding protein